MMNMPTLAELVLPKDSGIILQVQACIMPIQDSYRGLHVHECQLSTIASCNKSTVLKRMLAINDTHREHHMHYSLKWEDIFT
jgi:hypothetical protein